MKAVIFTLGCKVNEVESAKIGAFLKGAGFEVSEELSFADLYILNTCAVTKEAEKKSRQLIARARKFNPKAEIFVCGCASQKSPADFADKNITFVCGTENKEEKIISAVSKKFGVDCSGNFYPLRTKTRAFIKIEDGCNNFCSYCVIPYLRGREISRKADDILAEIQACDCPEIVLTGINISAYSDEGYGLDFLIKKLSACQKRVRLGSLECSVIDEKLLSALKELPDFAPQFHLSLQSGSSAVLKAMNRHYTREEYIEKCKLIYKFFPSAGITTDIIAGFPTETEEDFLRSLSIIEEVGFARVHAFAFSPREGTVAFKTMKDLPPEVKKERLQRLLISAKRAQEAFVIKNLGQEADFIAEEKEDGYTVGYTANYIRVYVKEDIGTGKKYKINLKSVYKEGAVADICR